MKHLAELIDLKECPRLIEKYKGIVALPLALPKFELDDVDEFWQIWNKELTTVARQHFDRGAIGKDAPSLEFTQWNGLALYEDETLLDKAAWVTALSPALANSQPKLIKSIFDRLPFVRIRSIRLWSAKRNVNAHYDGNMPVTLDGQLRFPTEIRIMIDDTNPTETFWLTSSTKYKPQQPVLLGDRHYVRLPADTNTFVWNNEDYLHGADYNTNYSKVLAVIKGWIDVSKLEILLDQSIEQYPNYVLREK